MTELVASSLSIVVAAGGLAGGLLLYIWRKNEDRLDRLEAAVNQLTALTGFLPAVQTDVKEHTGRIAVIETRVAELQKDVNHAFDKIRNIAKEV